MNGLKTAYWGLAAAVLLGAAITAGAQQGQGYGPGFGAHRPPMEQALGPQGAHGRWWNDPMMVERLKLTDDQRKAMDQILLEHREKLIDMRAGVEKAELAMEPLIGADQPNESAILAQIDKVAQARAELEKANARFLLAIRGKLTPEQWKELQAWRTQHHGEGRGEGMERRQWRDGGRRPDGPGARPGASPQGGPRSAPGGPQGAPGDPQSELNRAPGPDSDASLVPAPGAVE